MVSGAYSTVSSALLPSALTLSSVTRTCLMSAGYLLRRSSRRKSASVPANSTPAGPPPTTTKCSAASLGAGWVVWVKGVG